MTLQDRCLAFARTFEQWPGAAPYVVAKPGPAFVQGTWVIGNDYRNKTRFYGAYPASYLARVMALFPDALGSETLHVFSGSLPDGNYIRCDLKQPAELQCSVYDLPAKVGAHLFRLVIADPPYTHTDADRYGTPPVDRRRALSALAAVTYPGGYCIWLDAVWPMHRKAEWRTAGFIQVVRSTNHRVRLVTIFERQ